MPDIDYKYDVAFSFLAEDEELALQINDLIQHRVKTFIYSRKQSEIAGTDGEQTFNRVFGTEARTVFVLYRKDWGETSWTRIEETAIRNRAFEEGYDFVLFAPLDKPPTVPKWLPKNRIWIGLDRWGIEGVAIVIESRVQDAGGTPKQETVEESIARLNRRNEAEKRKQAFLNSENGVKTAENEIAGMFSKIESVVRNLSDSECRTKLKFEKSRNQCSIYGDNVTLFLHWSSTYSNTLKSSAFYVSLWKGFVAIRGSRHFPFENPTKLQELEFNFDQTTTGKPAWTEAHGQKRIFSTERLLKFVIELFFNKIYKNQL